MASLSLNTGLKALLSARYVLDTVGHNLANANTPGYSRQRVHLEASLALPSKGALIGSGVDVGRIERAVDALLSSRITRQQSIFGGLLARNTGLSELESSLGASDQVSLAGLLDGFFTSISDLSTSPADSILRTGMVQSSRTLASRFHEVVGQLTLTNRETGSELRSRASQVNGIADDIAELNVEIANTQSTGIAANDLLDRRDLLISQLSELVDLTTIPGANGTVGILVAGNTLVGQRRANHMSVVLDNSGDYQVQMQGTSGYINVTGGAIGGLLEFASQDVPDVGKRFDELAHQLVLSVNRLHSVGIPSSGSFSILTGANRIEDFDGDGKATDELLSNAGLPFAVTSGALYVNVEERSTGTLQKHRIDISKTHTTVDGFLKSLNEIPNLSADIDATGRLRIVADSGYGFDFSARIEPYPDTEGTFGSGRASLATQASGPYALVDGDTLTITADPGGVPVPFTVTFDQADFGEISQASAEEIAAVINADPNAQANGVVATVSGGALAIQTAGSGTSADFEISGGTSVASLGWGALVGSPITGHANSVDPHVTGTFTGSADDTFTFRPTRDGIVGTTSGLSVEVLDSKGDLVSTLEIGPGYVPGTELAIGDGVSVSFGLGELSATQGDRFDVRLVTDSDTSDVLVALGLNSYFQGSTAADIDVRADIAKDPSRISTSISGAEGDSSILIQLLGAKEADQKELGDSSIGQFYGDIIADLGFQTASTRDALRANDAVIQTLQQRRDAVSGVDVDEELVDLVAFEQAFQTASRFIGVITQLNDELLNLI